MKLTKFGVHSKLRLRRAPATIVTVLAGIIIANAIVMTNIVDFYHLGTHFADLLRGTSGSQTIKNTAHKSEVLAASTSGTVQAGAQIAPSLAACTPSNYGTPATIDLTSQKAGLSQIVDAPNTYQVYGYSAAQLEAQIASCAPKSVAGAATAEFTSETTYRLNWQYSYAAHSNGSCSLTDIKVGQHITMALPLWQPTQFTTPGLTQKWQAFMTNLVTHEDGHVALDKQYAATILSDLQTMPQTDCSSVTQAADYLVNEDVSALNQANDSYDSATNHGATQGAILP